ncbi:unnamed protein product [Parnassius mnemosyne]|uniref:Uncharacterized protein n=1 Tax=Parnassius mnemosyne TaxID=213953 RepID=A0AAV1L281_9NEOP
MVNKHPSDPRSNVHKYHGYHPAKYALNNVSLTVRTDDSLTPGCPPCLTQKTVGLYLQPISRELAEMPPRPTIDDLPDAVIDRAVQKDKAFWVDKPGANAYTLHDAYNYYGMTTEVIKPPHQEVLPRSYQFELDCVKYRRQHACDGLKHIGDKNAKPLSSHCHDCQKANDTLTHRLFIEETGDTERERWRYYPDVNTVLSPEKIRELMDEVGRPFKNEACNWYYIKYPPQSYKCILRKFST